VDVQLPEAFLGLLNSSIAQFWALLGAVDSEVGQSPVRQAVPKPHMEREASERGPANPTLVFDQQLRRGGSSPNPKKGHQAQEDCRAAPTQVFIGKFGRNVPVGDVSSSEVAIGWEETCKEIRLIVDAINR